MSAVSGNDSQSLLFLITCRKELSLSLLLYLTKRLHVAMCMFGNRSQKASKRGEKKQEAQEVPPCNKFLSKLILIIFNKLNFFFLLI